LAAAKRVEAVGRDLGGAAWTIYNDDGIAGFDRTESPLLA
jgi:hypothetical protein